MPTPRTKPCLHALAHAQAGRDIFDLGESLYAFLLRYGEEFDYERDAVSVASGGIVPKQVRASILREQFGFLVAGAVFLRLTAHAPPSKAI